MGLFSDIVSELYHAFMDDNDETGVEENHYAYNFSFDDEDEFDDGELDYDDPHIIEEYQQVFNNEVNSITGPTSNRDTHQDCVWVNEKTYDGGIYTGEMKDDVAHGHGTFESKYGDVYDGDFIDGKMNGHGTLVYAWGGTYTGSFVEDKIEGSGILVYPNGILYNGDFVNNLKHGKGRWSCSDEKGNFMEGYEGTWKNDKMDGIFTHIFAGGGRWKEYWKNGKRKYYCVIR